MGWAQQLSRLCHTIGLTETLSVLRERPRTFKGCQVSMPNTLDLQNLHCAQWRQAIQPGDFKRGKAYASQGRSTLLQLQGTTLTAHCRGSVEKSYKQSITLLPQQGYYDINGRCSCYVGYNCKHVVAALLTLEHAQQQGQAHVGQPAPAETAPPTAKPALQITDAPAQQPQPHLSFGSVSLERYDQRSARMLTSVQHRAALAFNYQGHL